MNKRANKSDINAVLFNCVNSARRLTEFTRFKDKKIKMTQQTEENRCQQSSPDRRPSK